jgi:hypothetical protein
MGPSNRVRKADGLPPWSRTPLRLAIALASAASISAAQAAPVTLRVESARTEPRALGGAGVTKGQAIGTYRYIINVDDTGTTAQRSPSDGCSPASPGYPGYCNWTSVAGLPRSSPIYRQGDQGDFASPLLQLPPGRYLVSVLAASWRSSARRTSEVTSSAFSSASSRSCSMTLARQSTSAMLRCASRA